MTESTAHDRAAICGQRLDAVRGLLERRSADALLLGSRRDFAWLTVGGLNHVLLSTEGGAAPLLVTRDDAVVLAPVNEHARIADEEIAGLPLRAESLPWWDGQATQRAAAQLAGGGRVLRGEELADDLTRLRSLLAPLEHSRMAALAELVREATDQALAGVRSGLTEDEAAADIAGLLAAGGARLPVILAAADGRIERYRHPLPGSTPIERRLMVVVVAERWGLHVAHTQLVELEPRPPEIERRAQLLVEVLAEMRSATRPGNTLGDVLRTAGAAYEARGMGEEWTLHHQGGTIGYQAREQIAKPDDPTVIEAGMAFAWNPSTVGFKLEETLYLDGNGQPVVLTTTPV